VTFPTASLQVGLLEVTSLPQLLLALAAIPKAPKHTPADSSTHRERQLEGPAKQKLPPALVLQKLLPALPDKVGGRWHHAPQQMKHEQVTVFPVSSAASCQPPRSVCCTDLLHRSAARCAFVVLASG
jgi:hypothetical protein